MLVVAFAGLWFCERSGDSGTSFDRKILRAQTEVDKLEELFASGEYSDELLSSMGRLLREQRAELASLRQQQQINAAPSAADGP